MAIMRNVNTIEFNGQKACINSYSDHPALIEHMNKQREGFAARYPNAIVKTERMVDRDIWALVENDIDCHAIGSASLSKSA